MHTEGLPNFRGAHLAVPTSLNLPLWRSLLSEYTDAGVCDFLEFGWPIGYDYSGALPRIVFRNHRGAIDFPSAIDSYLSTELGLGSVCGPFARNPFSSPYAVSPLNSVPKQGSDERHFILDLSWPEGSSDNDGICKDFYLGELVNLTYPTVNDIAECTVQFEPAACCSNGNSNEHTDSCRLICMITLYWVIRGVISCFLTFDYLWVFAQLPWPVRGSQILFVSRFLRPVVSH